MYIYRPQFRSALQCVNLSIASTAGVKSISWKITSGVFQKKFRENKMCFHLLVLLVVAMVLGVFMSGDCRLWLAGGSVLLSTGINQMEICFNKWRHSFTQFVGVCANVLIFKIHIMVVLMLSPKNFRGII